MKSICGALALLVSSLISSGDAQQSAFGNTPSWPRGDAAVFSYPNAFGEVLAYAKKGDEPLFDYELERRGFTRIDGHGALQLRNGSATAPLQDAVLIELLGAGAFTLEAWVTFPEGAPEKPTDILTYGERNFALVQHGERLAFEVRGAGRAARVEYRPQDTQPFAGSHHIAARVGTDGSLSLFVDGEARGRAEGAGRSWKPGPLRFGSGTPQLPGWSGSLEGFAVHAAELPDAELRASAQAYGQIVKARKPLRVTRLEARLTSRSRVPTPNEVAPYPEALAVFEYEVVRVLEGFYLPKKMRVAHWVVLGEKALVHAGAKVGETYELTVVDFARNRQLETVNLSDTLEFDFDLRLFHDIAAPVLAPEK